MRYAILSDIHGNHDALTAVLDALSGDCVDSYVCLGDIVGYGPEPRECLREVRKYCNAIVAGNHDFAVCGKILTSNFNVYAKEAILWTRQVLSEEDVQFLAELPLVVRLGDIDVVHGSLYAPELFDYLQTSYDAALTMEHMEAPICFVGHSHVPVTFTQNEVVGYCLDSDIEVRPYGKVVVNVGSIGQPRDKNPRASCAIYDSEEQRVLVRRVQYDVDLVAAKIQRAGLPGPLGERLRLGR